MRTKTGIFGGSFNPIHIGHLLIANYICEYGGVDDIWFMVSPQNPLKEQEELMADNFRLEMVRAAIGDYPKFRASDFEFSLPRPSYTIDTLDRLKQTYPDRDFCLIVGEDNLRLLPRWKEYERLAAENEILVYPRSGHDTGHTPLTERIRFIDAPLFEVSSTFIRQALKEGKDIRYFLHPEVYRMLTAK